MTYSGVAQQIGAMRARLMRLHDRIQAEPISNTDLQSQILEELQSALEALRTTQQTLAGQAEIHQILSDEPALTPREERLRELLQQRELLLREVHHRVRNNLQVVTSLLDLQALRTEDPDARELLRNNQSRISLIALVHESLYQSQNLTAIDFSHYLQNLAVTVFRIYTVDPTRISLRVEVSPNITVNPDQAIPAGLILNELISNALRHGFREVSTGEVVIRLETNSEGQISLTVSNSGDPLPADFDLNQTRSLGLQLVNSLVRQIEGTLELERGNWTTFRLTFDNSGGG
jgi:two-component system, sensor histidine kinase PdtaS